MNEYALEHVINIIILFMYVDDYVQATSLTLNVIYVMIVPSQQNYLYVL